MRWLLIEVQAASGKVSAFYYVHDDLLERELCLEAMSIFNIDGYDGCAMPPDIPEYQNTGRKYITV